MNFMSQAFAEEDNNQIMSTRGKFPSLSSSSSSSAAAAAAADLSLGLSSSSDRTVLEKEHMFDKVVTPSDVGKLNRLVIPKQHAERYFPLDSSTNEKGLLLNFEDRNGKPWRFRYSYWNSSQSYVMTKGWSRFVKDKKLDAGDIVSFHRGLGQLGKDRLFIDWRRRPETVSSDSHDRIAPLGGGGYFSFDKYRSYPHHLHQQWNYKISGPSRDHGVYWQTNYQHRHQYHQSRHGYGGASCNNNNIIANPGGSGPYGHMNPHLITRDIFTLDHHPVSSATRFPSEQPFSTTAGTDHFRHLMYLRSSGVQTATRHHEPVYESVPVVVKGKGKAEKKRLRLFGVNMDCPSLQESGEEIRVLSSSSSSSSMLPRFVNKGKSSFDLDI